MLLKCQIEPFLTEFSSKVVSCNEVKQGKKRHYEVALEDSILFAEGGGQPADMGVLFIEEDNSPTQEIKVLDVQRRDGTAIHVTDNKVIAGMKSSKK